MSHKSYNDPGVALVFGAKGGIGSALTKQLKNNKSFSNVIGFSRNEPNNFNIEDENSIIKILEDINTKGDIRLAIDATGFLHDEHQKPEKQLKHLNTEFLLRSFRINAIGPALIMKHLLPKLPRSGRSVFVTLSARVGSIGDNFSGGWYSYRASKAALNQFVRTASLELSRTHPESICIALHPGTVDTNLSRPFSSNQKNIFSAEDSALKMIDVINKLTLESTGGFFDWNGKKVPW